MTREHIHFITGRLAEHALRRELAELAPLAGFDYSVGVMPITVAALLTPAWIAPRLDIPPAATRILLPGYCEGDPAPIEIAAGLPVQRGPRDLRRLADFFGRRRRQEDYGQWDIEIIAEINHCPRLKPPEILAEAARLKRDGADLIDVGCDPGGPWMGAGECVRALVAEGHRVSIDSLDVREIEPAVRAGAELVLSVNSTNRAAAGDWGCRAVAIPDDPRTLAGLDDTIESLAAAGVPLLIDPILEPIGCGFAASLGRYIQVRERYPDAEMLMGIGNLTELTDADSAGINVLLLGMCQELAIRSVLTTQVISWAATSVRECDLARRLVHYAVTRSVPPKHLEPRLVTLRDDAAPEFGDEALAELAAALKDNNYRIFAERDLIHLVSAGVQLCDADPFLLFEKLLETKPRNIDASHAFYLGFEMCKALTALTLGKEYRQDESLDWGFLTRPEKSHRLKRKPAKE